MITLNKALASIAAVERRMINPASDKARDRIVDRQTEALAAAYLCPVHTAADLEAKLRFMAERCRVSEFPLGDNEDLAKALEVVIADLHRIERARRKAAGLGLPANARNLS